MAISLYCSETVCLTADCIVVMVNVVVFKITLSK